MKRGDYLFTIAGIVGLAVVLALMSGLPNSEFILRLIKTVLVDFGVAAAWPAAAVAIAYVLRNQIGDLVEGIIKQRKPDATEKNQMADKTDAPPSDR